MFRGVLGQREREGRTAVDFALNGELAPVQVHDLATDVESETESGVDRGLIELGVVAIDLIQAIENARLVRRVNPASRVAHGDAHQTRLGGIAFNANGDRALPWGIDAYSYRLVAGQFEAIYTFLDGIG